MLLKNGILPLHSVQHNDVPDSSLQDFYDLLSHSNVFYLCSQTSSIRCIGILLCLFLSASEYLTGQKTYSDENLGQRIEILFVSLHLKTAENLRNLIFDEEKNLSEHDKIIKQRCCNLVLLEEKYNDWK